MILLAFCVYDSAAEAYLQPFFCRTRGEAIRSFRTAVNTADHNFSRFPDDYILFHVGEFHEGTGKILGAASPTSLGVATEYMIRDPVQRDFVNGLGKEEYSSRDLHDLRVMKMKHVEDVQEEPNG